MCHLDEVYQCYSKRMTVAIWPRSIILSYRWISKRNKVLNSFIHFRWMFHILILLVYASTFNIKFLCYILVDFRCVLLFSMFGNVINCSIIFPFHVCVFRSIKSSKMDIKFQCIQLLHPMDIYLSCIALVRVQQTTRTALESQYCWCMVYLSHHTVGLHSVQIIL